jgi:release factor glutamine methyltransferase
LTSEVTGGVTVSQILKQAVAHLRSAGIAAPKLDAWLLFEHSSGMEKSEMIAHPERIVDGRDQQVFLSLVARRAAREPVSRILGIREFYSRPDTETLIDQALALTINSGSDALRICDFGTGSGILLVTLLAEWPGCLGFGVDIDENAVRTARLNACRHGVAERAQFCVADWDAALDGYFDLIVSNPPYIVREQIVSTIRCMLLMAGRMDLTRTVPSFQPPRDCYVGATEC